jgi:phage shock protein PspC (stress-responsive transcriptional regulator)
MSLADELERLKALHASGALSDEEFARAKARLLAGESAGASAAAPAIDAVARLRRSRSDRWLGGVCGGFAVITGVESWIWRLVLVVLALFGGTGVLLYLLLWIFVPEES